MKYLHNDWLYKRKYNVISLQEGCWTQIGSSGNSKKALGIIFDFVMQLNPEESFKVYYEYDKSNDRWQQVHISYEENEEHAKLEYQFMIFYEDKVIKKHTSQKDIEKYQYNLV